MVEPAQEIEKLDPKRRALLERLLAAERGASPEASIPRRPDAVAPIPLSAGQERLWFLDQLAPGNPAYNMPAAFRLKGPLDPAALHGALREIVRRHEALRTTLAVTGGELRQVIAPRLEPALPLIDLVALPRRQAEAAALAGQAARAPFDLGRGPLLRASLLRLGAAEHVLLLAVHHAVSDGWSMGVLFRELEALYAAVGGARVRLPELPIQYADFAVWQRERLQGPRQAELAAYWKRRLAGAPPVLDLPADRPRPPVRTYRGRTESLAFPGGLGEELRQVGRRRGATLFMTLLAAFAALLGRWSGGEPARARVRRPI